MQFNVVEIAGGTYLADAMISEPLLSGKGGRRSNELGKGGGEDQYAGRDKQGKKSNTPHSVQRIACFGR